MGVSCIEALTVFSGFILHLGRYVCKEGIRLAVKQQFLGYSSMAEQRDSWRTLVMVFEELSSFGWLSTFHFMKGPAH